MDGGHKERCERRFHEFAAMLRDAEVPAEERLGRGGAEANDDFRPERGDFGIEPRPARGGLGAVWLFVNAPLAARLPFEVFDGIGDVGFFTIDPRFLQSAVQ